MGGQDYTWPKRCTREKTQDIILGSYKAGILDESMKTSTLGDKTGLGGKVGRASTFLDDIGVFDKDGYSVELTDEGEELGKTLQMKLEDKAAKQFQHLLADHKLTDDIQTYVSVHNPDRDELFEQVLDMVGKERDQQTTGLNGIIDLWEWSGLLELNGEDEYETNSPSDHDLQSNPSNESKEEKTQTKIQENNKQIPSQEETLGNTPISVNLEFKASDDPAEIKEVISAVRKSLQQDVSTEE